MGVPSHCSGAGLSPEPTARSGAATGRYDAATQEFQLRALADAAFMLQVGGFLRICPRKSCELPPRKSHDEATQEFQLRALVMWLTGCR